MLVWGSVMLLINIALVSSIIIILVRCKTAVKADIAKAGENLAASAAVVDAFNGEMTALRCAADAGEASVRSIKEMETRIVERQREIEQVLSRARDVARHIDAIYNRRHEGVDYSDALKLLESGMPSEDVMARLGLLKGEFELISSISSYRS